MVRGWTRGPKFGALNSITTSTRSRLSCNHQCVVLGEHERIIRNANMTSRDSNPGSNVLHPFHSNSFSGIGISIYFAYTYSIPSASWLIYYIAFITRHHTDHGTASCIIIL